MKPAQCYFGHNYAERIEGTIGEGLISSLRLI